MLERKRLIFGSLEIVLCQAALNQEPEKRPSALQSADSLRDIQQRTGAARRELSSAVSKKDV